MKHKAHEEIDANHLQNAVTTTKGSDFLRRLLARGQSGQLWHFPTVSGCCAMEYNAALASDEIISAGENIQIRHYSPKQSDLLIISGVVNSKSLRVIHEMYQEMVSPKWVLAIGSCVVGDCIKNGVGTVANLGGVIPIDVVVPGCPPTQEDILVGLMRLKKLITGDEIVAKD